jgi:hypothetical protein
VDYVNEDSALLALKIEQLFRLLPPVSGVLFVSVTPRPELDGICIKYDITLGLSRKFETDTGAALIGSVLGKEIARGFCFFPNIVRGVSGPCRDEGSQAARPSPS